MTIQPMTQLAPISGADLIFKLFDHKALRLIEEMYIFLVAVFEDS